MNKDEEKIPEWRKEARVGLVISLSAVLLFGGIYAIANNSRKHPSNDSSNNSLVISPSINTPISSTGDEVDNPLYDPMNEILYKPFKQEVSIARYFYDMNDDLEIRSQAIVAVPGKTNTYTKSLGVDYTYKSPFDIYASCSGTVIAKSNDAIYGNMLLIEHQSGIRTLYCSLGDISVNKGAEVRQGDKIATSGESTYTSGLGQSLHFEVIKKDETYLNPEKLYNQLIKSFI